MNYTRGSEKEFSLKSHLHDLLIEARQTMIVQCTDTKCLYLTSKGIKDSLRVDVRCAHIISLSDVASVRRCECHETKCASPRPRHIYYARFRTRAFQRPHTRDECTLYVVSVG